MKLVPAMLVAAIGGASCGLVVVFLDFFAGDEGSGGSCAPRGEFAASRAELRELLERVARVEQELAAVSHDEPSREPLPRSPRLPAVSLPDADAPAGASAAALDPRRLLAEFVASFADGGSGSDFFRMAVAAYAWQLRRDLLAIVGDSFAPDALRLQVMAMLDGGSFRGDGATIDALLEVLRRGGWTEGANEALAVLGRIGDRRTAELLEAISVALEPLDLRAASWAAIVKLCGGDADVVLLRLLEREHDPEGRAKLIALFPGADLAAALRAFEIASRMEQNVRLEAAGRIGRFRDERFTALIDEWLTRESDDEVRSRLLAAQERQRQVPRWHELQATGAPDVADASGDDPHAWAPAAADGGREWLELTYADAIVADRVTIHEVCRGGGVVAVDVQEPGGSWRNVWSGEDSLVVPGPFTVRFSPSSPVNRVRVTLDTKRRAGWDEIDAVQLAGPGASAWASKAAASSRYGEGQSSRDAALDGFFRAFRVKEAESRNR